MKERSKENPFNGEEDSSRQESWSLTPLTIKIRPDLYRAYQRCSWIIIHETGRSQLDIMQEMVEDFLIKHGC
ncbi:MAG: hypothetical protein HY885_12140 [Deltaproteobacteria bacterium]|nr:hypothetical protein [Deltaproteobacteria bacterium]